ncbi:efflux RND transporter periplasmic adaptor subunit [Pseudohalocynthiibacter aestuariivivens]|jgi:RND family efflux transporter MFP subunit|uniref:Efflux RND transporter periplasmic adaptor subunit n=1 Tax=Pseudohalocynthiibacter aestuariivivens TaxID=1591409 RepID=A0ABV5JIB1_9RHOB|nr:MULTISPECIES: efflux transporter periplasmic adaptor subunit [Pseudohalocynthiibacter]MBS9717505.1 efflux transporter periplasmic adaptor subunit [Pseudohalocynthiibacter aestuariivivens]MCK0102159.1 efflux transporter periplasmic adaptor subunit [Pseudohalocynthiibacter sp. F2068]
MRFLARSLMGLFLLSVTVGFLAMAGAMFYNALLISWAEDDFTMPNRERIFAANVVRYEPGNIAPVLTAFGEVRSRRTLDLRATASGTIVELTENFVEGGRVEKGALLARIDPSEAQSELQRAQTDVLEAEAEVRDAARSYDLAVNEQETAEAQLVLRQNALARQRDLRGRGVGTEASVEAAELAEAVAQQSLLSRRQAIAQAEARIDQADTELRRQKINLADAERELADTEIFAEFSGTLGDVSVVQGGLVANNERIARLTDPDLLEVSFRVSTTQYTRLLDSLGALNRAPVEVLLDVYGVDLSTSGVISRESASVGEGQTGRLLFAHLKDARGFRPGDFVTVKVREPELIDVALLPSSAVDSAETVLLIGPEDRLEVASVELLRRQGDDVIVRGEMLDGRELVAERSPLLGAGIKVRPIRSNGSTTAQEQEMLELSEERRARLVAFVTESDRMPEEAKTRVLGLLAQERVPAQVVERIEARIGG